MVAAISKPAVSSVNLNSMLTSSQARHGRADGYPTESNRRRQSRSLSAKPLASSASKEATKRVSEINAVQMRLVDTQTGLMRRREALVAGIILLSPQAIPPACAEEDPPLVLLPYEDTKGQFSILRPETWEPKSKSGAVVLFQDPQVRTNNIGIVINPVRINSLTEFGTIDVVADRLLKAELKKESTNSAGIISMTESRLRDGTPLYRIEYHLDSTRGVKRVLTAVTISNKKLFIANATLAEPPSEALLNRVKEVIESFDVLV